MFIVTEYAALKDTHAFFCNLTGCTYMSNKKIIKNNCKKNEKTNILR